MTYATQLAESTEHGVVVILSCRLDNNQRIVVNEVCGAHTQVHQNC